LSAAWTVRREHIIDIATVTTRCELADDEAELVERYVIDEEYTHDELLKLLVGID
jgi:hypothetical protein